MHATTRELIAIRDGDPVASHTTNHVQDCPACHQAVAALRDLQSTLRALPEIEPPASAWTSIDRRLAETGSAERVTRRRVLSPLAIPLAMAASLAGLLSLGVWLSGNEPLAPTTPKQYQTDTAGLASHAWQEQALELEELRLLLGTGSQPMSLAAVDTIDVLDRRIQSIGLQLNESNNPDQRLALWQEKVHLLEAAFTLEAAENETFQLAHVATL